MKGIILIEFADFAASAYPEALPAAEDPRDRGRPLDAVARYDPNSLAAAVDRVSAAANVPAGEILRRFGIHLFARFAMLYPVFLLDGTTCLEFLAGIPTTIHGEILKLHPDAEFPHLECRPLGSDRLELVYRSERGLADLAEGLLLGCIAYFREPIRLERTDLAERSGRSAEFVLTRQPDARDARTGEGLQP